MQQGTFQHESDHLTPQSSPAWPSLESPKGLSAIWQAGISLGHGVPATSCAPGPLNRISPIRWTQEKLLRCTLLEIPVHPVVAVRESWCRRGAGQGAWTAAWPARGPPTLSPSHRRRGNKTLTSSSCTPAAGAALGGDAMPGTTGRHCGPPPGSFRTNPSELNENVGQGAPLPNSLCL